MRFWVSNAAQAASFYTSRMGFEYVAYQVSFVCTRIIYQHNSSKTNTQLLHEQVLTVLFIWLRGLQLVRRNFALTLSKIIRSHLPSPKLRTLDIQSFPLTITNTGMVSRMSRSQLMMLEAFMTRLLPRVLQVSVLLKLSLMRMALSFLQVSRLMEIRYTLSCSAQTIVAHFYQGTKPIVKLKCWTVFCPFQSFSTSITA